jgi:hypothetical protein
LKSYEYAQLEVNMCRLEDLNSLGSVGWHVVGFAPKGGREGYYWALLERELTQ